MEYGGSPPFSSTDDSSSSESFVCPSQALANRAPGYGAKGRGSLLFFGAVAVWRGVDLTALRAPKWCLL